MYVLIDTVTYKIVKGSQSTLLHDSLVEIGKFPRSS